MRGSVDYLYCQSNHEYSMNHHLLFYKELLMITILTEGKPGSSWKLPMIPSPHPGRSTGCGPVSASACAVFLLFLLLPDLQHTAMVSTSTINMSPVADPDLFPRFPETGHKFLSIDFLGEWFCRQTCAVYFV